MRKRTTRCLALLLAVVMILSVMPVAMAEETTQTTWTKTTLSDIKEADTIAITMTKGNDTWVLPTTGKGSKKQPLATKVAVNSSTLTTSGSDGFGWTITAVEGGYHIKTGSKYLYLTAANNGMRIGTTECVWSLSTDNYLTAKDSKDDSRYLGVFNGTDWRCYTNTTGNIAGQTLNFWKLDAATQQVATPTANVTDGAEIEVGTQIKFECATEGATIYYKTAGTEYQEYTGAISASHNETYTVMAKKDGMTDSKELVVSVKVYKLVDKYVKAETIATDDKVVIYNAGNGYAVAGEMLGSYYLKPAAATVDGNALTADSFDALVWTVTKNEDGTYTFKQGENTTLTMGTNNGKFNLNLTGDGAAKWDVETCNAENASYYMSGNGVTGNYGKVYMEYYAKYTEFSAYCTSTDRLTEKDFGMTFYKLTQDKQFIGGLVPPPTPTEKVATPTANPAAGAVEKGTKVTFSCTTEGATILIATDGKTFTEGTTATVNEDVTFTVKATKADMDDSETVTFTYTVKAEPVTTLKDGKYVIYNPGSGKAMSAEATGTYYRAGKAVTVENGKVADPAEDLIWTVKSENGVYTITTENGDKLSMNNEKNSLPLNEANNTWKIEKAATEGCYYIINTTRKGSSGDPYYVEWYANTSKGFEEFSTYFYSAKNESIYAMQFIPAEKPLVPDGQYVIYNPGSGKAMSAEATGTYYRAGKAVTVTDGKVENPTADLIWNVSSTDGVYTITTADGQKLSMNDEKNSLPLDAANTAWTVAEAATEGCFYIINATRKGSSGDPYYVEWYTNTSKGFEEFSTYFYSAKNESIYAMQFLPAETVTPPSGDLPKAGDKVVIYNQNAKAVLAKQTGTAESPSIDKALAEIESGKAIPENGAVVFEVQEHEGYLRFYNETYGYLCSGGTGNNAFYSLEASNDADWTVRKCSGSVGGFEMEHRTAKYNGKYSQWLEYYSDAFKTYSMYNVTDYTIYSFFFYPVADGVTVTDGIVNMPAVNFGTIFDAYVGQAYTLNFTVDAVFGVDTLTAKLGTEDLTVNTTENGYSVTIPVEKVTGDKLTVTVSGQDTKGAKFEGIAVINVLDEAVITNVTPAQGAQTGENKRPEISAEISNAGEDASVMMTVNGTEVDATYADGKVTYTPAANMEDGKVTVTVTVKRADNKETSKTWSFTIGKATFQRYFGQLHSHTQYSDGAGSLESALAYIKALPDSANVDFVAFTDHSNYFDGSKAGGEANPEGALYDMSLASAASRNLWDSYKNAVAAFNTENAGSMVAIAGFEMTWSGGPGHINTFNTPGIVSRNNTTLNNKTKDAGLQAYYKLLSQPEGVNSISQFNHPGTTFGNFIDFGYWDAVVDTRMYMVEVGNGEGQIGAGGYYPSYEQYIMALDKGWHVAPTNNQDNHKGRWGNANDARDVILTDDFSENGIYAALRARRMYATEDKNLVLDYTVNGNMMGSIIDVPEKLNFEISFNDPDRTDSIAKVELVVNSGKVAYTWDSAAALAKGSVSVELAPEYTYYFVRVTEGDGDLAVTAPVWVGESLKLGISKAECGTSTPVTDEELTITTTFFNSEAKEATIKSITYAIGGETIGTVTDPIALAASSTQDVEFKYTPTKARIMTVKITAVLEQNGKEYTFTKDVALDVLDASKLVYIGIDASHYNEYVAGNYKDSMGNFGELAAASSVRTVTLKTSEELIDACKNSKYKALILTAPSRRLEAAQADPKTYSEEELKAIAAFNNAGGMVILAGWSDNYENYDVIRSNPAIKHMAATQNEVLAALGSSLRISDDATYDDVRSAADGVDKWRLYFSTYNMSNPLLKGVEFDEEHPYDKLYTERFSHYGGASIYAVDVSGNATDTLPATVSPVVYGHATTYSVDVDSDGLGGAATPKYTYAENDERLMVMASEEIEGKGLIIVSGAAFMSNFEVQYQASDSGAEKNYSNYKICQNLVAMLNQTEISSIAAVQNEADEGVKFTVEGIVTSNASGYDADTAFFDCIYVQDGTAGINAFPVAGNFKIGDKVRITGTTSSYQGERQLAVTAIEKIGEGTAPAPKEVTAAQINDGSVLGSLVKIKGTITRVEEAEGLIQTIMVRDAAGNEARVFIDGYITTGTEVQNAIVDYQVEATGLASYDNTFVLSDGTAVYPRIRIRNRADIVCTESGNTPNPPTPPTPVVPVNPSKPGSNTGKLRFNDVSRSDWYYDDVQYVNEKGIMDGTSANNFAPNAQLTRAMIVTILYRMEDTPAVSGASAFTDVESGKWYAKAVAWAAANGIVNGYGSGLFGPNDPVTREQLAAILYRYTAYRKASTTVNGDNLAGFTDLSTVSGYALESMNWAVGAGLLKGAGGRLDPKANATRAQVAAIIHRYLER